MSEAESKPEDKKPAEAAEPAAPNPVAEARPKPSVLDSMDENAELSAEDFEKIIAEDDPEFLKSVNSMSADKLGFADIDFDKLDLEDEYYAIIAERDRWKNLSIVTKLIVILLPFIPWISVKLKKSFKKLKFKLRGFFIRVKNFGYFLATNGKDGLLKWFKNLVANFGVLSQKFKYLPVASKLFFVVLIFASGGLGFFIYKSVTKGVIHKEEEIFLRSFDLVASETFEYDPSANQEPFFENLRAASNLILIPKMIVNLKASKNSGNNPMAALEIFIEGMTPEVTVEIKDREIEVRHTMLREMEDFTYDEVESATGKEYLIDRLVKRVNQILTTGKIRRILIKTVIVKP
jgi:flagellar basal body-associated protein FliL